LLNENEISFRRKADFDPEAYFRNVMGITVTEGQVTNILLEFRGKSRDYVKTLPWHHSQELVKEEKEHSIVRFYLLPTQEFKMAVLAAGDEVRVLEPLGLAEEIRKTAESIARLYI